MAVLFVLSGVPGPDGDVWSHPQHAARPQHPHPHTRHLRLPRAHLQVNPAAAAFLQVFE